MDPISRAVIARKMEDQARAHHEARAEREHAIDADEFRRSILGRVRPGQHDAAVVLNLPDAEAKDFRVHVCSPTGGGAEMQPWQSFAPSARARDLVITRADEPAPADSVHSQSVAELRAEALATRARARALTSSRLPKGMAYNRYAR